LVKNIVISERGAVNLQIQANELFAGTYTYLLVGDDEISEAIRMILTE